MDNETVQYILAYVSHLLRQEFIEVDRLFDNHTPATYRVTYKGLACLQETITLESLIQYVKTFVLPRHTPGCLDHFPYLTI